MNRRDFLRAMGCGAVSIALGRAAGAADPAQSRPNVVFILVDDLGWADVACCGSAYYETPNIDRLAVQGVRFTQGYAACAVCSPTRAAIMTGRYPARLGITDWIRARFQGGVIPEDKKNPAEYVGDATTRLLCPPNALWMELDEVTIAEALKPAGYATCHIGKWHLGADDWYPDKQGFDQNIGGCDFGQPPSYFDPYERDGQGRIDIPPRKKGEYLTDREADEAIRFIREHRDVPFFLNMAHYAVHMPIQGKQELVEKYEAKPPTRQKNPAYAAMIESVDQAVGRILAALDELGIAENTLVIFTSDNGGLLKVTDNAPLRAGKGYPYEGGLRVPVIMRWPGVVAPGWTCDTPVCSVDFFPTICAAAGAPLPADRPIDGADLAPVLRRSGELERDALFWHFPHYREDVLPYSIIRAGDWKLIRYYEGKPFELFNLRDDPAETHDYAGELPDKVHELDVRLATWLTATEARLPRENPGYQER